MHSLANPTETMALEADLRKFCATTMPDTPLLPERRLAERYGVTHAAVRKVLKRLHDDGAIYRQQGRGTFVAADPATETGMRTIVYVDVWHQLAHPYYVSRLRGIMGEGRKHQLRIQMFDGPPVETQELYAEVARDEVAGVILPYADAKLEHELRNANAHLAILSTGYASALTTITHVVSDHQSLGAMAAAYLLRQGATRPFAICAHQESQHAFESACAEAGVKGATLRMSALSPRPDDAVHACRQAQADGIAFDDEVLAAAVHSRLEGFHGPLISQFTEGASPPMAKAALLAVDGLNMGRLISRTLNGMIHHDLYHNTIVRVRPRLIDHTETRRGEPFPAEERAP